MDISMRREWHKEQKMQLRGVKRFPCLKTAIFKRILSLTTGKYGIRKLLKLFKIFRLACLKFISRSCLIYIYNVHDIYEAETVKNMFYHQSPER